MMILISTPGFLLGVGFTMVVSAMWQNYRTHLPPPTPIDRGLTLKAMIGATILALGAGGLMYLPLVFQ